jgi:hypothetical protein
VIPALPLIVVRPFLPESPAWKAKREAGTLRRPSILELFRPEFRRTTIVTTLMFAMSYGAAFGAIQLTPTRMVPGLPEVKALRDQALALKTAGQTAESAALQKEAKQSAQRVQFWQEIGGLLGRFALAFLAVRIASRRNLLRIFQVPGLLIVPLVFYFPARNDLELLKWGMLAAGFFTVAQFSFWGNYLPRVYPVYLRGTGEGFAANIGGRMLGTSAAFVTTNLLAPVMPGASTFEKVALAAALVALLVYLTGTILCFFLPEPKGEDLPD